MAVLKITQDISKKTFTYVPEMDMTKKWTDKELYSYFDLNEEEIRFIEGFVRNRD